MVKQKSEQPGFLKSLLKANSLVNKVSLIAVVVILGILLLQNINNGSSNDNSQVESAVSDFPCQQTPNNELISLDKTGLQTITEIAAIDYEQDVTNTALGKNDVAAIFQPKFSDYSTLEKCLTADEQVIVLIEMDQVRVYPKRILEQHLVINDIIKGLPVIVTYSPLGDHFAVYISEYKHEIMSFGVSGKLYKNNDLLFDLKTESLWSQFNGKALVGNLTGAVLEAKAFTVMSFATAKQSYPSAQVLSFDTGYRRDYRPMTDNSFFTNNQIVGKIINHSDALPLKEKVLGFFVDELPYVFKSSELKPDEPFISKINGKKLEVAFKNGNYEITLESQKVSTQVFQALWYVWYDFYPETKILN